MNNFRFNNTMHLTPVLHKAFLVVLCMLVSLPLLAQQRKISGTVTDNTGEPMVGTAVFVKSQTSIGSTTDMNGNYTLSVPEDAAILVFSSIGYEIKEIDINNQMIINVELLEKITALDEVTVTALGISREKKALGYSVGEVKGENMTRVSQENVLGALSGKVAGVQIQNTGGDPGSTSSIIIRGATSLSGDNQPLFVIDGVPVSNSLNNVSKLGNVNVDYGNAINDINPEDIESISVLKGPSAAALYGSRAGSGVILVTTKSGSKRKGIGVTITSSVVFDQPVKFVPTQTRFTTGAITFDENQALWFGPELDKGNTARQWGSGGERTPLVSYPGKWDEFFDRPGYTVDNNIGITGSYDRGSFRMSYGNMQNRGVVLNTGMTRNTFNLAPVYKLLPNVIVSANVNISQNKSDNRPATGGTSDDPTVLVAVENLPPHIDINTMKDYWLLEPEQQNSFAPSQNNPYFLAHEMTNGFKRNRVFGNVKLDWKILDNLSLMGRFAMDRYNELKESKVPYSYTKAAQGGYGLREDDHIEINADFLASYETSVSDFRINASLGGNLMRAQGSSIINRTQKLAIPGLYSLKNADGGPTTYVNEYPRKIIRSIYGMATISYKNMAYLDITGRNDWSSTLPADNRSYFYPSASFSLLINELLNISTSSLNMLKLRAGWAQVGNDTQPYSLYPSFELAQDWGKLKRASLPSALLTPDLKPEIATSKEVGLDFSALRSRINLGVTYYVSDNKNQILSLSDLAPSSGYTSKKINAGLVQSSGWEIELRTVPFEAKNMRWTLDFSWTRNRTKVKELTEGMNFITLYDTDKAYARTMVGEYIGDIWGYAYKKVEDASSPYNGWPLLSGNRNTGYRLEQLTDDKSMVRIGNFNHDFLMGITTGFSWKSLSFSAQIDWRQGGQFFSATERRLANAGHIMSGFQGVSYKDANNLPAEIKANPDRYFGNIVGGFTQDLGGFAYLPGSQYYAYNAVVPYSGAFIPGVYEENGQYVENLGDPATTGYTVTAYAVGEMWDYAAPYIHDATFVKLREISVSYALPQKWLQPIRIHRLSVSVFCRNVMLWAANNMNLDPERAFNINNGALQQGLEKFNMMPQTVSYGAKINLEF